VGKSRMATEVQARAGRLGWGVLVGGCSESELAVPYLPVVEAIGNSWPDPSWVANKQRLGPLARAGPALGWKAEVSKCSGSLFTVETSDWNRPQKTNRGRPRYSFRLLPLRRVELAWSLGWARAPPAYGPRSRPRRAYRSPPQPSVRKWASGSERVTRAY
jgi:hypothetical protein